MSTALPAPYPPDDSLPSATDDEPIYSLDFDTSFDPFGILPETAQLKDDEDDEHIELDLDVGLPAEALAEPPAAEPRNTPVEASKASPEKTPADLPEPEPPLPQPMAPFRRRQADDAPAFATYLRDSRREPSLDAGAAPVLPAAGKVSLDKPVPPPSVRQEPTLADRSFEALPAAVLPEAAGDQEETPVPPADEEPAFVTQGRRREQSGKALRAAMALGSVALLLLLLLQVMTTFRNPLAAQFPQWKPALVALCAMSGCQVDLPAQIEALSIEQGELQTLKEQTFSYVSLLRNQSRSVQAWPSIELILNDANDKPVLRRVIAPREYLPATIDVSQGFAPRSEQTIKLYFALDQLTASGYHIAIFYP